MSAETRFIEVTGVSEQRYRAYKQAMDVSNANAVQVNMVESTSKDVSVGALPLAGYVSVFVTRSNGDHSRHLFTPAAALHLANQLAAAAIESDEEEE